MAGRLCVCLKNSEGEGAVRVSLDAVGVDVGNVHLAATPAELQEPTLVFLIENSLGEDQLAASLQLGWKEVSMLRLPQLVSNLQTCELTVFQLVLDVVEFVPVLPLARENSLDLAQIEHALVQVGWLYRTPVVGPVREERRRVAAAVHQHGMDGVDLSDEVAAECRPFGDGRQVFRGATLSGESSEEGGDVGGIEVVDVGHESSGGVG